MTDNEFKKVCKISDLNEKIGKRVIVDDVEVALFNVDGKIHALSNICPHKHAAIIYDGFIEEDKVYCPSHGWAFNLETGNVGNTNRGLDKYEVKIDNDEIYVKVFKKEMNW